ncbi:MAG: hypothetical protein MZU95_10755 [Desulfomicrobium escambiense]|nr:hypothetical protein [Desulfomicrobium escambiense]
MRPWASRKPHPGRRRRSAPRSSVSAELERDSAVNLSLAKKSIQDDAFYNAKVALNVWKAQRRRRPAISTRSSTRTCASSSTTNPSATTCAASTSVDRPARRPGCQPSA